MTEEEPPSAEATEPEQDSGEQPSDEQRPILRIVKGDATPEEIAAIVAVFASLGGGSQPPGRRTPEWSAHHRKVRRTLHHGPGRWRSSALPG